MIEWVCRLRRGNEWGRVERLVEWEDKQSRAVMKRIGQRVWTGPQKLSEWMSEWLKWSELIGRQLVWYCANICRSTHAQHRRFGWNSMIAPPLLYTSFERRETHDTQEGTGRARPGPARTSLVVERLKRMPLRYGAPGVCQHVGPAIHDLKLYS